jgi:pimeloyl-ACP methyl ester carboxylesterase
VLVHGAGANALVWEPLRRELSSFDLLAPSLPGRLGSEPAAFEDAASTAAWLADLLEALGSPRAWVLGHSYGGAVALELASRGAPLAGLILVATGARLRVHPAILESAAQAAARGEPLLSSFAFAGAAGGEAAEAYERASAQTAPDAALRDWRACDVFDARARLATIDLPVLVVGGSDDALTPPKFHTYLAENLPRAQLTMLDGAGHMLPWERPRELAALVRAFASAAG